MLIDRILTTNCLRSGILDAYPFDELKRIIMINFFKMDYIFNHYM